MPTEDAAGITRLRSRHRRFDRRRAARSRLLGSLVFELAVTVAAAGWLLADRAVVALAWALFAVLGSAWAVWDHRSEVGPARVADPWTHRGHPSAAEIAAVLPMVAVFVVTLRFGLDRAWGEAVVSGVPVGVVVLVLSWWRGRRTRSSTFLNQIVDTAPGERLGSRQPSG